MKSFLLKDKMPIMKWGSLPEETYFEGNLPEGYSLAISPSGTYIVLDVDKHGDIDGFENIPWNIQKELSYTLTYRTKNNGQHFWLNYSGDKKLANRTSGLGIDLRTDKGYVVWYSDSDIRDRLSEIKISSDLMNQWLESLFYFKLPIKKKKSAIKKSNKIGLC